MPPELRGRYLRIFDVDPCYVFHPGQGRSPGEASFAPIGSGEDEGYLITFVYDAATDRSDLLIVDAADMTEVASVHLPARVPYGSHGSWVSDT